MKIRYLTRWICTCALWICVHVLRKREPVLMCVGILILVGISFKISYEVMASFRRSVEERAKSILEETKKIQNMRSEFVANASHELKTPLTSISGFIETLQSGAVEDEETRNKFINIMAEETDRLKRLINDILVLSDVENTEANVEEEINVKEVVERITEVLKPILEEKGVSIFNEVSASIKLNGSLDRFKQMMLNLIENGIKYNEINGHVWIDGVENDSELRISVKDDGIGIGEKDLSRITERFYRVDKSRSNLVDGTGLGLSIVKHAAADFNGNLIINSKVGEGSEFIIVIPQNIKTL